MAPSFLTTIFTSLLNIYNQITQAITKYRSSPEVLLPFSVITPQDYDATIFPISYDQPIYYPQSPPYAHMPGTIIYNGDQGYWQYRLVTLDTFPPMPDDGVRSSWGYLYTSWTRPGVQFITQPPPSLQPPFASLNSTPIPNSFFED